MADKQESLCYSSSLWYVSHQCFKVCVIIQHVSYSMCYYPTCFL